ncbi:MAG: hypothetical protein HQL15_04925, partial [Candidatus Omnitrophica bacterium]|nr:hypothetical protein [Candidatus Omnitrophota bacterium]
AAVSVAPIVLLKNYDQMGRLADFAADLGVDRMKVRRLKMESYGQVYELLPGQERIALTTLRRKRKQYEGTSFEVYVRWDDFYRGYEFLANETASVCWQGMRKLLINPVGVALPCVYTVFPGYEMSKDQDFRLGCLYDHTSFEDFWKSTRDKHFAVKPDSCGQSSFLVDRLCNKTVEKLFDDQRWGVRFEDQPFFDPRGEFWFQVFEQWDDLTVGGSIVWEPSKIAWRDLTSDRAPPPGQYLAQINPAIEAPRPSVPANIPQKFKDCPLCYQNTYRSSDPIRIADLETLFGVPFYLYCSERPLFDKNMMVVHKEHKEGVSLEAMRSLISIFNTYFPGMRGNFGAGRYAEHQHIQVYNYRYPIEDHRREWIINTPEIKIGILQEYLPFVYYVVESKDDRLLADASYWLLKECENNALLPAPVFAPHQVYFLPQTATILPDHYPDFLNAFKHDGARLTGRARKIGPSERAGVFLCRKGQDMFLKIDRALFQRIMHETGLLADDSRTTSLRRAIQERFNTVRGGSVASLVSLSDVQAREASLVGGKGKNCHELLALNCGIEGYALTAKVFEQYVLADGDVSSLLKTLEELFKEFKTAVSARQSFIVEEVKTLARSLKQRVAQVTIPVSIKVDLERIFLELGCDVSVRSSATIVEDSRDFSFAGCAESFLHQITPEAMLQSVNRVWQSLYEADAVLYCLFSGVSLSRLTMPVIIQRMINGQASGVVHTWDVRGNRPAIRVTANSGLGISVVQGNTLADSWLLSPDAKFILERLVANKTEMVVSQPQGGTKVMVSDEGAISLNDEQVLAVARIVRRIQGHYRMKHAVKHIDVEFVIDPTSGQPLITQVRPLMTREHLVTSVVRSVKEDVASNVSVIELEGITANKGAVSGVLQVIRDSEGFDQVREGAIVVTTFTGKGWNDAFGKIRGVITETGNDTSHAAIITREPWCNIPSLVGSREAIDRLKHWDGREVTFDAGLKVGGEGVLPIEERTMDRSIWQEAEQKEKDRSVAPPFLWDRLKSLQNAMVDSKGLWFGRPRIAYGYFQLDYYDRAFALAALIHQRFSWPRGSFEGEMPLEVKETQRKIKDRILYAKIEPEEKEDGVASFMRSLTLEGFEFLVKVRREFFEQLSGRLTSLRKINADNCKEVCDLLAEMLSWTTIVFGMEEVFEEKFSGPELGCFSDQVGGFNPRQLIKERSLALTSSTVHPLSAEKQFLLSVLAAILNSDSLLRTFSIQNDLGSVVSRCPDIARRLKDLSEGYRLGRDEDLRNISSEEGFFSLVVQQYLKRDMSLEELSAHVQNYGGQGQTSHEVSEDLNILVTSYAQSHGMPLSEVWQGVSAYLQRKKTLCEQMDDILRTYPRLRRIAAVARENELMRNDMHDRIVRVQKVVARAMLEKARDNPSLLTKAEDVFDLTGAEFYALCREKASDAKGGNVSAVLASMVLIGPQQSSLAKVFLSLGIMLISFVVIKYLMDHAPPTGKRKTATSVLETIVAAKRELLLFGSRVLRVVGITNGVKKHDNQDKSNDTSIEPVQSSHNEPPLLFVDDNSNIPIQKHNARQMKLIKKIPGSKVCATTWPKPKVAAPRLPRLNNALDISFFWSWLKCKFDHIQNPFTSLAGDEQGLVLANQGIGGGFQLGNRNLSPEGRFVNFQVGKEANESSVNEDKAANVFGAGQYLEQHPLVVEGRIVRTIDYNDVTRRKDDLVAYVKALGVLRVYFDLDLTVFRSKGYLSSSAWFENVFKIYGKEQTFLWWGNQGHEARQITNSFFYRLMDENLPILIARLRREETKVIGLTARDHGHDKVRTEKILEHFGIVMDDIIFASGSDKKGQVFDEYEGKNGCASSLFIEDAFNNLVQVLTGRAHVRGLYYKPKSASEEDGLSDQDYMNKGISVIDDNPKHAFEYFYNAAVILLELRNMRRDETTPYFTDIHRYLLQLRDPKPAGYNNLLTIVEVAIKGRSFLFQDEAGRLEREKRIQERNNRVQQNKEGLATLFAVLSAVFMGWGISLCARAKDYIDLGSFSASFGFSAAFALLVAGWVGLFPLSETKSYSAKKIWDKLPTDSRKFMVFIPLCNALSNWAWFSMFAVTGVINSSLLMALSVIFNWVLSYFILKEVVSPFKREGLKKWLCFAPILLGAGLVNYHIFQTAPPDISSARIFAAVFVFPFLVNVFASLRTVSFRRVSRDYLRANPADDKGVCLGLVMTMFSYFFAGLVTLPFVGLSFLLSGVPVSTSLPFWNIHYVFLLLCVSLAYGLTHTLRNISLASGFEASRMALVDRLSTISAAFFSWECPDPKQVVAFGLSILGVCGVVKSTENQKESEKKVELKRDSLKAALFHLTTVLRILGWGGIVGCAGYFLVSHGDRLKDIVVMAMPVAMESWALCALIYCVSHYKDQYYRQMITTLIGVALIFSVFRLYQGDFIDIQKKFIAVIACIGIYFISDTLGILFSKMVFPKLKQESFWAKAAYTLRWTVLGAIIGGYYLNFIYIPFLARNFTTTADRVTGSWGILGWVTNFPLEVLMGVVFAERLNIRGHLRESFKSALKTLPFVFLFYFPAAWLAWSITQEAVGIVLFLAGLNTLWMAIFQKIIECNFQQTIQPEDLSGVLDNRSRTIIETRRNQSKPMEEIRISEHQLLPMERLKERMSSMKSRGNDLVLLSLVVSMPDTAEYTGRVDYRLIIAEANTIHQDIELLWRGPVMPSHYDQYVLILDFSLFRQVRIGARTIDVIHLANLSVTPSLQGGGIGKGMINARHELLKKYFKGHVVSTVSLQEKGIIVKRVQELYQAQNPSDQEDWRYRLMRITEEGEYQYPPINRAWVGRIPDNSTSGILY